MSSRIRDVDLDTGLAGAKVTIELPDGRYIEGDLLEMRECAVMAMDDIDTPRFQLDVRLARQRPRTPFQSFKEAEAALDEKDAKMAELGRLLAITTAGDVDAKRLAFQMLRKVKNNEMTVNQALRVAKMSFAAYKEEREAMGDPVPNPYGVKVVPVDEPEEPSDAVKRFNALDLEED